ncbi:sensor histidine kinase [Alteromonadaceae bacterium M269]|nr:sensor histidine kinase [Alteromonadaceae bacterium M269]
MSLRSKTIIGIAIIEALLLILLISVTLSFMRSTINDGLTKRASTAAQLFATTTKDAVLSYDLASLDAFVTEVLTNPDMQYARVLDAEGNVFSEKGTQESLTKAFRLDKQVEDVDDNVFDTYALIKEGDFIYGRVEIGIGVSGIQNSFQQVIRWTSGLAITEMLLVALFSFVLGTYLTRQIKSLVIGAKNIRKAVSDGNYDDIHIEEKGHDELTEVAHSFNRLVDKLQLEHNKREEYQRDLENLNQSLEQRVERRTKMLADKNEQLQQTNQELQAAQAQLLQAEKMSSLGQLAAGVAHEINNPIGFVNSNLSSLSDYVSTYEQLVTQLQDYLGCKDAFERRDKAYALQDFLKDEDMEFINNDISELVHESIEGLTRVKDIVQSLKQFARADSNEMQYININACVETTLKMVSNELKYHCEITTQFAELPDAPVNVGKLTQVLTNLLVNAGHAIEGHGEIKVSTQLRDNHIAIAVQDNGKGIEKDHLNQLFDPFFTTKEEGVGTGLGLAISYGIVQEHGGEIEVDSVINEGTTFTVVLPLEQKEQGSTDLNEETQHVSR